MMNVGNPERAFGLAALPNDGVGLARMEFIITDSIKAHPMALIHPERIADARERAEIARLTANYASPGEFFVAAPVGGRRDDRRRLLSKAGHRSHVGLQDQ